ncbi:T6SS phospholipase effector Tle1-like catalytic domain-containing protein [Chryseobacterium sp. SIMBA_029]|uniref:T6SS phospholipase effector Tle1-like catalytic domain-containing protein n=1 Tax=Chryseobacterium sp. SIMBA_029 TaxID=3085772 RepID=UPI00397D07D3
MGNDNIVPVGIFFDGTGNNGINASAADKLPKTNESYYGACTNIFKLFNLFTGDQKLYVEGIGTMTGEEDSNIAMATCANPPGCEGYSSDDKLNKAYSFVQEIINDPTQQYQFYIFGFSRGCMLARNFCNQLLAKYPSADITIKFLGVFDTVESKPFNDYNVNVPQEVENALHLCAVNECRFFFPLTGFFETSKNGQDTECTTGTSVWKEVFVPGAHADVGGGYLETSQSVYISTDFINSNDLHDYVADVRNAKTDAEGNKIWDSLLSGYQIDSGEALSQAYVSRDNVYQDLSKVYGRLMLEEANTESEIFSTTFSLADFEIDPKQHGLLIELYTALEPYLKNLSKNLKPAYHYSQLADYTHISANFGLYSNDLLLRSGENIDAELINNGLNVPSITSADHETRLRVSTDLHLPEDSLITDFLYGTNVPNNDIWSRSILMK